MRALSYKVIASTPWVHLVLFWSLVARVYALLGHLPHYGEPTQSDVGLSLGLHFTLAGLTFTLFVIPPIWFVPFAAYYWHRLKDKRRVFWANTLAFAAGYMLILLHNALDPWGLADWFFD